ncbi:Hpt domain-containing protein [Novosphingobium mathurense]|uniref:Hpt domain-containing protein n=1 Tax=Novosphingobium mathurense TaxID=428990 RepID=UPI0005DDB9E8|nr:Hpt domain-containing protein [Novosphingobium mathurense]CDO36956.1 hypothetical protein SPHV1_2430038 [Novosphingobium sp. KN65.2]
MSDLEDRLTPLRLRFIERLHGNLPALLELRPKLGDDASRTEVIAIVHKIAGMAGTMGFPDLGAAARKLEECLVDRPGETATARADLDDLADRITAVVAKG